jgi:signal transduction histidine kinase
MIRLFRHYQQHIHYKIIVSVVFIMLLSLGITSAVRTWVTIHNLANQFEEETRRKARVLTEAIYNSVIYFMTAGHGKEPMRNLLQLTEMIESYSEVKKLIIFSTDGLVTQSSDPSEIGKPVDEVDLQVFQRNEEGTSFQTTDEMAFCLVKPIYNDQKNCASCHDPSKEILGILSLCLSMRSAQDKIEQNRDFLVNSAVISSLSTILLTAIGIAILMNILVARPIHTLVHAMDRVQRGNLKEKVQVKSRDELGLLAESFNQMIQRIKEYDDMKNDFISNVSHELRTPLTSIKYFAEVLHERCGTLPVEKQQRFLGIINEETDRLTRLINNFLDLQKIESGRFEYTMERLSPKELIGTCAKTYAGGANARNISLKVDVAPETPDIVGDRDRIFQILGNLLSNAVKFTTSGRSVYVSARPGRSEDGKKMVVFSIKDEGKGIPPEEMEKVFEKFYQVDSSATRSVGGTGLGLAIAREIVRLHGGRIWVESPPGEGAEFLFTLPVHEKGHGGGEPPRKVGDDT